MRWTWRIARIARTDIILHASFVLVPVYYWNLVRPDSLAEGAVLLLLVTLLFTWVVLHELGHVLVARRCGLSVTQIVLWPLGGLTLLREQPRHARHDLMISAAGPVVNLLLAGAAALLAAVGPFADPDTAPLIFGLLNSHTMLAQAMRINLGLAAFNLLPAFPLDGGHILRSLLQMALGERRAAAIVLPISVILAIGMAAAGVLRQEPLLVLVAVLVVIGASTLSLRAMTWVAGAINFLYGFVVERGYWYIQRERPRDAVVYYDRAIARQPANARFHHNRAWALLMEGDSAEAIAGYSQVIALTPDNAKAYADRGMARFQDRDVLGAIADYDNAQALGWDDVLLYERRGRALWWLGDLPAAIEAFSAAIARAPQDGLYYAARAVLHNRSGDSEGRQGFARNGPDRNGLRAACEFVCLPVHPLITGVSKSSGSGMLSRFSV